jgi:hypothetical protein
MAPIHRVNYYFRRKVQSTVQIWNLNPSWFSTVDYDDVIVIKILSKNERNTHINGTERDAATSLSSAR